MIKFQLFTLKDQTIGSSRLSWSRTDDGKDDSLGKLFKDLSILWVGLSQFEFGIIGSSGSVPVLDVKVELSNLLVSLDSEVFLDQEIFEWSGIDFNN